MTVVAIAADTTVARARTRLSVGGGPALARLMVWGY
jgi:hypothetical protein